MSEENISWNYDQYIIWLLSGGNQKDCCGVTYLNIRYHIMVALLSLPSGLIELDCSFNMLSENAFNNLPPGLRILNCSRNPIKSLEGLKSHKCLEELYCDSCGLKELHIPQNLQILSADHNLLQELYLSKKD